MRPIRLDIVGFTSFRDRVEIDFTDVDYFALTGPNGSGKSSIIDAMIFALYGFVPRYDNKNLVAPLITQGRLECRVSLEFSADDVEYRVVRVLRRTPTGGATTKEARLQRGNDVLAGDAKAVDAAVEKLLGLQSEHFTKCVVLPQGDFARLLRDTPGGRQTLLVKLLGIDIYKAMAQRANKAAIEAQAEVNHIESNLNEMGDMSDVVHTELASRLERLEELKKLLKANQPMLDQLERQINELHSSVETSTQRLQILENLKVPDEVGSIVEDLETADASYKSAQQELQAAEESLHEVQKKSESLPEKSNMEAAIAGHAHREKLQNEMKSLKVELDKLVDQRKETDSAVKILEKRKSAASEKVESFRVAHRAHDIARSLKVGEPCPVCNIKVKELPQVKDVDGLKVAENELKEATKAGEQATKRLHDLNTKISGKEGNLSTMSSQEKDLTGRLKGHTLKSLQSKLEEIDAVRQQVEQFREKHAKARRLAQESQANLERVRKKEVAARQEFERTRDVLGHLRPPAASRVNLVADYKELAAWATDQVSGAKAEVQRASKKINELVAQREKLEKTVVKACKDASLEVPQDGNAQEECLQATAKAAERLERFEKDRQHAEKLRYTIKNRRREEQIAKALGEHLGARRFEKWLLDHALSRLVERAGEVLEELSHGQYCLAMDDVGEFVVIDHRNADDRRLARTLSGGETFLASLALALALADELGGLASEGVTKLESIFLDEGFGTLDADSLDTVAAAIEELGSRGRMVGIITHIQELAERVPVRYDVAKGPNTSTVTKVVA